MPVAEHHDRAAPRTGRARSRVCVDGAVHQREDGVAGAADAVVLGGDQRIRLGHARREHQDHGDGRGELAHLAADATGQALFVLVFHVRHVPPAPVGASMSKNHNHCRGRSPVSFCFLFRKKQALADIARAGADAILVQDLGIARLARQICPGLPLHASTQMTISSAEAAEIAKSLGITRIVLPRELSIDEIRAMAARTDLELECFVHGALCVSWSGQCLTSEALQRRSANRGQCAQSCRMPYDLVVDGRVETARGDEQLKYLLSPRDLAAYDLLSELLAAGVCCFKIEGRMKGPEYVANVVEKYRRALDAAIERRPFPLTARDEEELRYSFSRGFSHGFLKGSDHQELVHGLYPGHRGVLVGRVEEVHARSRHVLVRAEPGAPLLKAGDRMLFDQGKPEDDEPRGGLHACDVVAPGLWKLVFGGPDQSPLDLRRVEA